jgi:uncharacterized membrane protein
MSALVQWIHVVAAVIGVGGIGFLLLILLPSTRVLSAEQHDLLLRIVMRRFRWVSGAVILLLLTTGLYNIRLRAWEAPWGPYWKWLTLKIVLAFFVFTICVLLTFPLTVCDRFRARRQMCLSIAFALAMIVILISAYLRG